MKKTSLSIIITVFSETFSLSRTIDRLLEIDTGDIREILLIVHPNSSAACIDICRHLAMGNKRISFHFQNRTPGVGQAIKQGMNLATSDYIAIMSADLETEPEAVHRMMEKIKKTGAEMVIGNRWLAGGGFYNYDPLKLILNWLFQRIFKVLFLTHIGDLTYGFKIMTKKIAKETPWKATLHEIYIETTLRPLKQGYHLEQVPTIWVGRREGTSNNSFFKNFRYIRIAIEILFGH